MLRIWYDSKIVILIIYFDSFDFWVEIEATYFECGSEKAILHWEWFRHQSNSFREFETSQLNNYDEKKTNKPRSLQLGRVKIILGGEKK